MDDTQKAGLEILRKPFLPHQISKLPKPTAAQTAEVKSDFKKGIRCSDCGGWHHPKVVHLDYVGHAALTDRLLEADLGWNWEPLSFDSDGLPKLTKNRGLWIKLTVCGITRLGYGDAGGKDESGDAEKERIGDALRNAAMRFGAALELWHKGELHGADDDGEAAMDRSKKENKYQPTSRREEQKQDRPAPQSKDHPQQSTKPTKCATTGRMRPQYCGVCPQKTACPENAPDTTQPTSAESPADNLSSFIDQIDKLGSVDEVMAWQDDNLQSAYNELSEQEYQKLKQYISQISEVLRGAK